jgi:flagellar hook-associated protein 1 FlgK
VTVSLGGVSGVTLLNTQQRAEISSAVAADGRIQLRMFWDGHHHAPSPPVPGGSPAWSTSPPRPPTSVQKWKPSRSNSRPRSTTGTQAAVPQPPVAGGPLLSMTAGAMSLTLATSDPAAIAAASSDGTENGNLLSLSALRGPNGVEGRWAALVAAQAQALNSAAAEAAAAATRRDNSFAARDEISGVDLDREAAELLRYQRAYDASARIIQVARETMQTILDVL